MHNQFAKNFGEKLIPFLFLNIRSVKNKVNELETLILGFEALPIVLLSESWLSIDDPDNFLPCYTSYNVYRCDRNQRRGGGVIIMVPKTIPSYVVTPCLASDDFECIWVCLDLGRNIRVRLGLVYAPPATQSENLIKYLEPLFNDSIPTALFGDFNYPDINWVNGSAPPKFGQENFFFFFLRVGLHQEIVFSTRQNNILDLILVNEPHLIQGVQTGPQISTCDHMTITGFLSFHMPKDHFVLYYDFRKANYEDISAELVRVNWTSCLEPSASVEVMWNCFLSILQRVLDAYIPLRRVHCVNNRWSCHTTRLCKRMYKFHCKYKKTECRDDYEKYIEAARVAQRAKRMEK